jgi:DNA-binding CsgD family transcriptional regulator
VSSRVVSPVFAGREAELAVLASAFDDAVGRVPGTVLVGAEAGGGKSRLVGEFAARVAGRALVLAGGCVELSAAGLPYAPFTGALRQLVRERGAAEVAALLPGDAVGELAGLLPDFGTPVAGTDPDTARGRLFEVLLALLEALAEQLPLVLVVEDVHWADRSARDLLSFLVRNLRHAAVLLVVTFRSDVLHRTHPLRPLLAVLGRMERVTRMELPRLSRGQVEAQLEGILGRPPEAAVTSAVYARSGGVPLFTEALVNADGTVNPGLPWSLRDLLLGAVKELPEQAQQVLRAAAAGGVRVGHELLAAVTGLDEAALAAALRAAVAANVMVADADGYAFRHELIREVVREDLLPGERAQVERAFAEALEADPALSPGGMVSVQLALHWRGAHEPERALAAAWAAAADAAAGFAFGVQLQMLEQVLELWDRVPGAAAHTGADRAGVIELAADAARWAGEPERGLTLVEAALGELGEEREADRIASLLLRRAELRRQGLLPGQVDDLRAALRLARDPTRVRAQILGQLSMALMLQNRDAEAKLPAEEMRALAEQLGDQECQTEAVITLAQLGHREGLDTITALQSARETARQIGSARLELRAYAQITHGLEGRGEHDRAIRASAEGLARAKQLGLARYVAAPLAENLAESLTSAGRWDQALEVIEEALGLDPAPFGRVFLLDLRGQIAVARGEQETAARMVQQLRSQPAGAQTDPQIALPLARLMTEFRLARGDLVGALAAACTIPVQYLDAEPRYLWPLLATGMRACADAVPVRLPAEAGDPAELRSALELAAAGVARGGRVEQAHAAVFAAEASRAAGHSDLAAWDAAAAAWGALGQPYPLAYALLRAAGTAAAAGNRDAAAPRLQQAAELAGQLRARPLLQQISQLARRARIEITGGSQAAAAPFGLTGRELEVLQLVAAGRGNREIAAALFISPKTASVHVSNILGKLGVASRGEAAATAHRLHIFDA